MNTYKIWLHGLGLSRKTSGPDLYLVILQKEFGMTQLVLGNNGICHIDLGNGVDILDRDGVLWKSDLNSFQTG